MPTVTRRSGRVLVVLIAVAAVALGCTTLQAQIFERTRGVGGVFIGADNLLQNADVDALGELARLRKQAMQRVPNDLMDAVPLRMVSLRRLETELAKHGGDVSKLPDEFACLAGLQRIDYVFVYPEQNDVVIAGPAEGWKVDQRGNVVGVTTGLPVLRLDDLLVALRTAGTAARTGISCSIDPTQQGLQRLQNQVPRLMQTGNPRVMMNAAEQLLGPQTISITGVPQTSNFARVLVAADYRMKRIGMKFEPAPVAGLPSYLDMMRVGRAGLANAVPRWWMVPDYQPLLRDPEGLAWQIRGAAVKTLSEESFLNAQGQFQRSGKTNSIAQAWADKMTEKYDDLAKAEPVFAELRNCMNLAIVAALIVREELPQKAGYSMSLLTNSDALQTAELPAPKTVDPKATVVKRGRNWVISASGGVQITAWQATDKRETDATLAPAHRKAAAQPGNANWWWN